MTLASVFWVHWLGWLALIAGCGAPAPRAVAASPPFALSAGAIEAGWSVLFGGGDLDLEAWRGFGREDVPEGWSIEGGSIYGSGRLGAPDLITREQFGNFELALEFRTDTPDRNSGVLYRLSEAHAQSYHTGPEFQILDGARKPTQRTGANYALHAPAVEASRAPGQWNEARIIARGAHVEHWLNGEQIVRYELWSADWERRVADSKFARWPDYGRGSEGHIGLQSHRDPVWFRNIRIRRLP